MLTLLATVALLFPLATMAVRLRNRRIRWLKMRLVLEGGVVLAHAQMDRFTKLATTTTAVAALPAMVALQAHVAKAQAHGLTGV
jgi:hypothetical protein